MIADLVARLGFWSWWVLGLVLLAVEVTVPGFFFLWFGIAALVVGAVAAFVDVAWQAEVVGFVVLAVASAFIGRRFAGTREGPSEDPNLNRRAARLEGRTFVLTEAIVEGRGRIRVDDGVWQVRGPDLPAGTRVSVTGADGAVLIVTQA